MSHVTNLRLSGIVVACMLWADSACGADMDVWSMRRAIDCLNTETLLEFEDAPISEILDYLAVREQLRFRVESPSLTAQRVSISVEKKTLGDVLNSLFAEYRCELAVATDGQIVVKPMPAAVVAMRTFVAAMARPPAEVPWKSRSQLMTKHGFREQSGDLLWLACASERRRRCRA